MIKAIDYIYFNPHTAMYSQERQTEDDIEYIRKDKVVAEMERRLDKLYVLLPDASKVENSNITVSEACNTGKYMALESFRKFLDTIEVKEVDLDFEQELYKAFGQVKDFTLGMRIAKHFYELGIKTKKGE